VDRNDLSSGTAMNEPERSGKAAFEVSKGPQRVVFLSEETVARLLDPGELLRELEVSFGALARGEVQCPPRPQISRAKASFRPMSPTGKASGSRNSRMDVLRRRTA
jgi:hypothetical protein